MDIADPAPLSILGIRGSVTLDLTKHKVPSHATSVLVYARVRSGYVKGDLDGEVLVTSGQSIRRLFFHTYHQSAWSYNSDYFVLPIASDRIVRAKVITEANGNFQAAVQVVGYEACVEQQKN